MLKIDPHLTTDPLSNEESQERNKKEAHTETDGKEATELEVLRRELSRQIDENEKLEKKSQTFEESSELVVQG